MHNSFIHSFIHSFNVINKFISNIELVKKKIYIFFYNWVTYYQIEDVNLMGYPQLPKVSLWGLFITQLFQISPDVQTAWWVESWKRWWWFDGVCRQSTFWSWRTTTSHICRQELSDQFELIDFSSKTIEWWPSTEMHLQELKNIW